MNRVYLMPKIIIVTFILLYFLNPLSWFDFLIALLISTIIVLIYQVLEIALHAKFYIYLRSKGKFVSKEKVYNVVHLYMKLLHLLLRINVIVYHSERFNPNKNYLITPNHQSNADATVALEAFKFPIAFVSKLSVSRLMIVNDWMKLMGCLYLDKDDMRGQIKIMKDVEEKLKQNQSVIIFPEGRRSFSPVMNDFKPGTFKMATKSKVDILPVTFNHVHKFKKNFPWRQTEIHVYFHESISYEVYKEMSTQAIAEMVQKIVESKIEYEEEVIDD